MERINTYYNNTMDVDGAVEYGFRRNKREIENTIKYNGLTYELVENLDGYGKALVYKYNDYLSDKFILLSYNTIVTEIEDNLLILNGSFSNTTLKHIKAFCDKYAHKQVSKKDCDNKLMIAI